jgi:hypothetical protein
MAGARYQDFKTDRRPRTSIQVMCERGPFRCQVRSSRSRLRFPPTPELPLPCSDVLDLDLNSTFVTSKNRNCQFDSNSECTHSVTHLMRWASTMHMRPIRNNSQGVSDGCLPRTQKSAHYSCTEVPSPWFQILWHCHWSAHSIGAHHSRPRALLSLSSIRENPPSRRSYHRPMRRLVSRRPMPRAVRTHLSP